MLKQVHDFTKRLFAKDHKTKQGNEASPSMSKAYPLRTQTKFPAEEGWICFKNDTGRPAFVQMEPWATGYVMQPKERFYVHVLSDGHAPTISLSYSGRDIFVNVYCADAIYCNEEKLIDLRDEAEDAKKKFSVTIDRDEDGIWIVECPAIRGCVSQGKTEQEALENIKDAIALCLRIRTEQGLPLSVEMRQVEVSI